MARNRGRTRIERDTLGAIDVPGEALYGAQTARAVVNFPIGGWRMPAGLLAALARIKAAFARANGELGLLAPDVAGAIAAAAAEVAAGSLGEHFPVDVFQTGSGTSTNMNMNEVLAHLRRPARSAATRRRHRRSIPTITSTSRQSSNDVVPTAIRARRSGLLARSGTAGRGSRGRRAAPPERRAPRDGRRSAART